MENLVFDIIAYRSLRQKINKDFHKISEQDSDRGGIGPLYLCGKQPTRETAIRSFLARNKSDTIDLVTKKCRLSEDEKTVLDYIYPFLTALKKGRGDIPKEINFGPATKRALGFRLLLLAWAQEVDSSYEKVVIKTCSTYKKLELETKRLQNSGYLFRGDTNCSYGLIPSAFRNLGENSCLDDKAVRAQYESSGVLGRYAKIFGCDVNEGGPDAAPNYLEFLEYAQHALGYSPLLDLTSSWKVALSFALCRGALLGDYVSKPAKITCFLFEESAGSNSDEMNFEVKRLPDGLALDEFIAANAFESYNDVKKSLTPSFSLLNSPNNDRMRVQKGKLLLLRKGTIIKGYLPWFFVDGLRMVEIRLPSKDVQSIGKAKEDMLNDFLKDNREYSYDCLMDPYKYIGGRQ